MAKLRVCYGDIVELSNGKQGAVKYIGHTDFFPGRTWFGIELDTKDGQHDGRVRDRVYFSCSENHGSFVQSKDIVTVLKRNNTSLQIPLNELVNVNNYGKGRVRFVGQTMFDENGIWYGIELVDRGDKKAIKGNTNGSIDNVVYFKCDPQCGVFVRPNQLKPIVANDSDTFSSSLIKRTFSSTNLMKKKNKVAALKNRKSAEREMHHENQTSQDEGLTVTDSHKSNTQSKSPNSRKRHSTGSTPRISARKAETNITDNKNSDNNNSNNNNNNNTLRLQASTSNTTPQDKTASFLKRHRSDEIPPRETDTMPALWLGDQSEETESKDVDNDNDHDAGIDREDSFVKEDPDSGSSSVEEPEEPRKYKHRKSDSLIITSPKVLFSEKVPTAIKKKVVITEKPNTKKTTQNSHRNKVGAAEKTPSREDEKETEEATAKKKVISSSNKRQGKTKTKLDSTQDNKNQSKTAKTDNFKKGTDNDKDGIDKDKKKSFKSKDSTPVVETERKPKERKPKDHIRKSADVSQKTQRERSRERSTTTVKKPKNTSPVQVKISRTDLAKGASDSDFVDESQKAASGAANSSQSKELNDTFSPRSRSTTTTISNRKKSKSSEWQKKAKTRKNTEIRTTTTTTTTTSQTNQRTNTDANNNDRKKNTKTQSPAPVTDIEEKSDRNGMNHLKLQIKQNGNTPLDNSRNRSPMTPGDEKQQQTPQSLEGEDCFITTGRVQYYHLQFTRERAATTTEDIISSVRERKKANPPPTLDEYFIRKDQSTKQKRRPLPRKPMKYIVELDKRPFGFQLRVHNFSDLWQPPSSLSSYSVGIGAEETPDSRGQSSISISTTVTSNNTGVVTNESIETDTKRGSVGQEGKNNPNNNNNNINDMPNKDKNKEENNDNNLTDTIETRMASSTNYSNESTNENPINAYICNIEPYLPFEIFDGSMVLSINGKDVVGMLFQDIFGILETEPLPIRLELARPIKTREFPSPLSPKATRGYSLSMYENGTEEQIEEDMLRLKEEAERKLQKKSSFWSNVFTRR